MAKTRKTLGRRAKAAPAPPKKASRVQLTGDDRDLIRRLAERTGLEARVVVERALSAYAAAAAPGMPLHAEPARKVRKGEPGQKLFISVDGKPEGEIDKTEFGLGRGEGGDVRLAMQLGSVGPASDLCEGGRHVFEDV